MVQIWRLNGHCPVCEKYYLLSDSQTYTESIQHLNYLKALKLNGRSLLYCPVCQTLELEYEMVPIYAANQAARRRHG